MNEIANFAAVAFVLVVGGVFWRTHRTRNGSAAIQLLGGLNVFAAALLGWMTAAFLFEAFFLRPGRSTTFVKWSSFAFIVVIGILWVGRGLVPQTIAAGKSRRLWFGHFMLLLGTAAHGSITFYMPVLIWLGLIHEEASAVLPWLAVFTIPLACLLWGIGLALIVDSGSNKHLQATREARAPEV